jgi:multidrug efflux pump subunit AcrA (membrane-fusion protein)
MVCLIIFFDDPFWVGHLERLRDGRLEVARVVFGAEPSNAEILAFIQGPAWQLPSSPPVDQDGGPLPIANPKRRQRAVARQARSAGRGTRSQQALALAREQQQADRRQRRRARRQAEAERQYALRQRKKKDKHRGH